MFLMTGFHCLGDLYFHCFYSVIGNLSSMFLLVFDLVLSLFCMSEVGNYNTYFVAEDRFKGLQK